MTVIRFIETIITDSKISFLIFQVIRQKLQKTASITLALKSMNKDYLALAMAKSLNELAHPLAAK